MTTPSSICMIRSASLARSRSCVTTISVCPKRLAQSRKSFIVSFPVFLSRFPVGSSANMICGFAIIDLAIATRCCCPPDSSPGYFLSLSAIPSKAVISSRNCLSGFFPSSLSGISILFNTVYSSKRLNC